MVRFWIYFEGQTHRISWQIRYRLWEKEVKDKSKVFVLKHGSCYQLRRKRPWAEQVAGRIMLNLRILRKIKETLILKFSTFVESKNLFCQPAASTRRDYLAPKQLPHIPLVFIIILHRKKSQKQPKISCTIHSHPEKEFWILVTEPPVLNYEKTCLFTAPKLVTSNSKSYLVWTLAAY